MEHSVCVSEDSGPSSGGAAQRGCSGKSCSLFLKIRTTCCGRMCGGDLDDADAEGLGKVKETVRERARRHAQNDIRAWARRRAPRTLSPLGGQPCGSTARCASCASSSQIHRSAQRQGGILRRYGTLLRLFFFSCVGQRAVFPARSRLVLVSEDSGAICGSASAKVRALSFKKECDVHCPLTRPPTVSIPTGESLFKNNEQL
jgi:hypothetical protein